jgi:hypothetical protein
MSRAARAQRIEKGTHHCHDAPRWRVSRDIRALTQHGRVCYSDQELTSYDNGRFGKRGVVQTQDQTLFN